jgi:hypothetical protein
LRISLFSAAFFVGTYGTLAGAQSTLPIRVVVKSSFLEVACTGVSFGNSNCDPVLHIRAEILGDDLELIAQGRPTLKRSPNSLLNLGEYQAMPIKNETGKPYLSEQAYDFRFADGERQHFIVVGRFSK